MLACGNFFFYKPTQVKDLEGSYLAIDIDFTYNDKKIPLWLFSFMKTVEMN